MIINFCNNISRSFTCDKQFSGLTIRGKGLCLVDFDHAVDTQVFPDDAMFIGSSEEHSLQCPAMLEGRPWKWQVNCSLLLCIWRGCS